MSVPASKLSARLAAYLGNASPPPVIGAAPVATSRTLSPDPRATEIDRLREIIREREAEIARLRSELTRMRVPPAAPPPPPAPAKRKGGCHKASAADLDTILPVGTCARRDYHTALEWSASADERIAKRGRSLAALILRSARESHARFIAHPPGPVALSSPRDEPIRLGAGVADWYSGLIERGFGPAFPGNGSEGPAYLPDTLPPLPPPAAGP